MRDRSLIGFLRVFAASMLGLTATAAQAQEFPARPLRIIVPFAAGATSDNIMRLIGQRMSEILKQPVIIDNRVGANGTIGLAQALAAPADGYTLAQISNTNTVAAMHMMKKLPFNPLRDMQAVGSIYEIPSMLAASPSFPARTFAEFVAKAKANPNSLAYAYSHATGAVAGESVKLAAGIELTAVPYKNGGQAITDVIGGSVPLIFTDVAILLPHLKSGKLKGLAITSSHRSTLLPEVPALREVLTNPMEFVGWGGLVAPAGTPAPVVQKLNAALNMVLSQGESVQFLRSIGAEPRQGSAEEFGKYIRTQEPLWAKALAMASIAPE